MLNSTLIKNETMLTVMMEMKTLRMTALTLTVTMMMMMTAVMMII